MIPLDQALPGVTTQQRVDLEAEVTPKWQMKAHCATTDLLLWLSEDNSVPYAARRICRECPVRLSCLATALLQAEHGVWAGTTEAERLAAIRQLRSGAPVPPVLEQLQSLPTVPRRYRRSAA